MKSEEVGNIDSILEGLQLLSSRRQIKRAKLIQIIKIAAVTAMILTACHHQ